MSDEVGHPRRFAHESGCLWERWQELNLFWHPSSLTLTLVLVLEVHLVEHLSLIFHVDRTSDTGVGIVFGDTSVQL